MFGCASSRPVSLCKRALSVWRSRNFVPAVKVKPILQATVYCNCQITRVSSDVKNKRYELSVLKLFSATE
jgi:hypothetical protein